MDFNNFITVVMLTLASALWTLRFLCPVCLFLSWVHYQPWWIHLISRSSPEVDSFNYFWGQQCIWSDQTMESRVSTQPKYQHKQMVYQEKKAAVEGEMNRMNLLPANSTYAVHRIRVLNKILQLLSIQVCDIWPALFPCKIALTHVTTGN